MSVPKVKQRMRKIPKFRNEDQERDFWAIRLPESMIDRLKVLANKRDVPYQSLLKMFVADKIEEELRSVR